MDWKILTRCSSMWLVLFLVLFYVYPLKFVSLSCFSEIVGADATVNLGWHEASVLMRIYAAGFAAVFLLFVLMYAHAYRLRRELGLNPVEVLETRFAMQENGLLALVGISSLLVAFKSPGWAGWVYLAIGPLLAIHGSIFGKRVRRLAERLLPSP